MSRKEATSAAKTKSPREPTYSSIFEDTAVSYEVGTKEVLAVPSTNHTILRTSATLVPRTRRYRQQQISMDFSPRRCLYLRQLDTESPREHTHTARPHRTAPHQQRDCQQRDCQQRDCQQPTAPHHTAPHLGEVELRHHRRRRRDGRVEQVGVLESCPPGKHAGVGACKTMFRSSGCKTPASAPGAATRHACKGKRKPQGRTRTAQKTRATLTASTWATYNMLQPFTA